MLHPDKSGFRHDIYYLRQQLFQLPLVEADNHFVIDNDDRNSHLSDF
jgi:hypothetical protein